MIFLRSRGLAASLKLSELCCFSAVSAPDRVFRKSAVRWSSSGRDCLKGCSTHNEGDKGLVAQLKGQGTGLQTITWDAGAGAAGHAQVPGKRGSPPCSLPSRDLSPSTTPSTFLEMNWKTGSKAPFSGMSDFSAGTLHFSGGSACISKGESLRRRCFRFT